MAIRAQGTRLLLKLGEGEGVAVGKLSSVGEIAPEAEEIDVTTLESEDGYREYMQGIRSAGEIELTGFHDAGDAGQCAIREAFDSGAICAFEVVFSDGMRALFNGFVKHYSIGAAEVDGAIGFGASIRISGAVSIEEVN